MEKWQRLTKSFQRGIISSLDFIYTICPNVNSTNVSRVCESIPDECEVDIICLVTYQPGSGRICHVHSDESDYIIDDDFRTGLESFRNFYFSKYGPLQFGDHLYLKMRELQKVMLPSESGPDNKTTRTVPLDIERQLEMIGELAIEYPPVALASHIT